MLSSLHMLGHVSQQVAEERRDVRHQVEGPLVDEYGILALLRSIELSLWCASPHAHDKQNELANSE
eukprot:4706071-Pleurochrysis_carterae.AAC.2